MLLTCLTATVCITALDGTNRRGSVPLPFTVHTRPAKTRKYFLAIYTTTVVKSQTPLNLTSGQILPYVL